MLGKHGSGPEGGWADQDLKERRVSRVTISDAVSVTPFQ